MAWSGAGPAIRRVSSWLVQCLALVGERERAIAMFEGLAGRASDLGLFAEQIDPQTGEQLGNFPQAFSHIALIDAAWLLINTTCPPDNI